MKILFLTLRTFLLFTTAEKDMSHEHSLTRLLPFQSNIHLKKLWYSCPLVQSVPPFEGLLFPRKKSTRELAKDVTLFFFPKTDLFWRMNFYATFSYQKKNPKQTKLLNDHCQASVAINLLLHPSAYVICHSDI